MKIFKNKLLIYFLLTLFVGACSTVPITNRKSLKLLPSSMMLSMSLESYNEFLHQNTPLPAQDERVEMVRNVGSQISSSVEQFLRENDLAKRIDEFKWEFNVVEDQNINAWCMPGGKIVFYTGILPITQNADGVAVVMGHEIAHAVAQHGNERMTQQLAIYVGAVSLDIALQEQPETTREVFLMSYGVASQLGSLKYSRVHEYEADKLGMVFMAKAGYNPAGAIEFWKRMSAQGGSKPPEFLSTHPNDDNRVKALQEFLPEAMKYYNPSGGNSGGNKKKTGSGTINL